MPYSFEVCAVVNHMLECDENIIKRGGSAVMEWAIILIVLLRKYEPF